MSLLSICRKVIEQSRNPFKKLLSFLLIYSIKAKFSTKVPS